MKLNNADGDYSPSFFNMIIDTNEDLNVALQTQSQTFVHEFIHYIQDLVLPYNIRLNLTNLDLFSNIQQSAIDGKLTRPFNEWNENSKVLKKQREYTFGQNTISEKPLHIVSIHSEYFTIPSTQARVFKYTLALKQPKSFYHVGAIDMLEYIADKIEARHYSGSTYQAPYKTIDNIFDYYHLSDIPVDIRLCIVEFCLYNDNPIHVLFHDFLSNDRIKNNKGTFKNYEACYSLLLNHYAWHSKGGFDETVTSKTLRRLNSLKTELTNHYGVQQFDGITLWIEKVMDFTNNNLVNKFVFSDMYKMQKAELFDYINSIIDAIGFPLIMNKSYQCAALLPHVIDIQQFSQFYILQKFLSYVETKSQGCPIYDFCNANGSICDTRCKTALNFCENENESCPYSLFLKTYNLRNFNKLSSNL